jgi:hypothetical protein
LPEPRQLHAFHQKRSARAFDSLDTYSMLLFVNTPHMVRTANFIKVSDKNSGKTSLTNFWQDFTYQKTLLYLNGISGQTLPRYLPNGGPT